MSRFLVTAMSWDDGPFGGALPFCFLIVLFDDLVSCLTLDLSPVACRHICHQEEHLLPSLNYRDPALTTASCVSSLVSENLPWKCLCSVWIHGSYLVLSLSIPSLFLFSFSSSNFMFSHCNSFQGFDCPAQWVWLEEACSSSTGLTSKFKPTVSGTHYRPASSGFRRPIPLLLSMVIAHLFLVYPLRVMNVASYFTEKKEPSRGKLPTLSSTPACQSYLLPVSCCLPYTWRICLFWSRVDFVVCMPSLTIIFAF